MMPSRFNLTSLLKYSGLNNGKGLTEQAKKDITEMVDQAFDGCSAKIIAPVFTKLETRLIKFENGIDELKGGQKNNNKSMIWIWVLSPKENTTN